MPTLITTDVQSRDDWSALIVRYEQFELVRRRMLSRSKKQEWHNCSPKGSCPGWFVETNWTRVERCDACGRFDHDDDAVVYVVGAMRKRRWIGAAMCGSLSCTLCFVELNRPGVELSKCELSAQELQVHRTVFALIIPGMR